jgi:hypothetical protein
MERYNNNTVANSCIEYITINGKTETIQNDVDMKDNNSVEVMMENDLKDNNNDVENVGSIFNTRVPNEPIEVASVTQT